MKNVRVCVKCKEQKIRVELEGRFVDEHHNSWRSDRVCPNCVVRKNFVVCAQCKKTYDKKFKEQEFCSRECFHSASQRDS